MEFKTADNRLIDGYSVYRTKNMRRPLLKKAGGASHNKPEKLFGAKSDDGIFFAGKPRRDKPGDKR